MLILGADGILVIAVGTESDIHGLCDERNCFEETLGNREVIYALCEGYIVSMIVMNNEEYEQFKKVVIANPDVVVGQIIKAIKG